jgi:hypothetical protein
MLNQPSNTDIVKHIISATIDVVSRRTTESYALVVVSSLLNKIQPQHPFLKAISIKSTEYAETIQLVTVDPEIDAIALSQIGQAMTSFIEELVKSIGKAADFYFLRELKDDIGLTYEPVIQALGIDLDFMQFQYLVERRETASTHLQNTDILKKVIIVLLEIVKDETSVPESFKIIDDLLIRLSTKYSFLKEVTLTDVRYTQGSDSVTVNDVVNTVDQAQFSEVINRLFSEVNQSFGKIENSELMVERIKARLTAPYVIKLEELGVDIHVLIRLRHELIFKHVFKALIEVLSRASTASYAVMALDSVIKKINAKYTFLNCIKIDSTHYSEGIGAISIMTDIEEISPIQAGKSIQKIIEELIRFLGEEAGQNLIEQFKTQLGKTYLVRIEEMGVNLHMVELRQNLMW